MSMQENATHSNGLIEKQANLLQAFVPVSGMLRGVAAVLWLPGGGKRFDGRPKPVGARTRPLAVTMEVTDSSGLSLSGAISAPTDAGKLRYQALFRYEFTQPMAVSGDARGEVLSAKNVVIAHRGLNLLTALVRFGQRLQNMRSPWHFAKPRHPAFLVPFNPGEEVIDEAKLSELAVDMSPELWETYRAKLAQELVDRTVPGTVVVDSRVVPDEIVAKAIGQSVGFEDYGPVLGLPHWNPAAALSEMPNPAAAILSRRGIGMVGAMDQATLDSVAEEFRKVVPLGERLVDEEIFDALLNPGDPVRCAGDFADIAPSRIIESMRLAAGHSRARGEATNDDLLRAAWSPNGPLYLSQLSATQIVLAEDLMQLPAPYCGNFLPQLDWAPRSRNPVTVT